MVTSEDVNRWLDSLHWRQRFWAAEYFKLNGRFPDATQFNPEYHPHLFSSGVWMYPPQLKFYFVED